MYTLFALYTVCICVCVYSGALPSYHRKSFLASSIRDGVSSANNVYRTRALHFHDQLLNIYTHRVSSSSSSSKEISELLLLHHTAQYGLHGLDKKTRHLPAQSRVENKVARVNKLDPAANTQSTFPFLYIYCV